MTLKAETDAAAGVLRAKRARRRRKRTGGSAVAEPTAREFLRRADRILRERGRPHRSLAASYLFASEFEKGT